jgi:hypothetical protein
VSNYSRGRRTRWLEAAEAIIAGHWTGAADVYDRIGARSSEAFARLRAGEQLARAGRRAEADAQLLLAVDFCRSVRATRYLRQAEALLAASA